MKNKLNLIIIILIALCFFTVPVSAQEEDLSAYTERLLREADERLDAATENYQKAKQTGNPEQIDAAKIDLRKALDNAANAKKNRDLVKQQNGDQPSSQKATAEETPASSPVPNPIVSPSLSPSPRNTTANLTANPATPPAPGNQIIVECADRKGVYSSRICSIAKAAAQLPKPQIRLTDSASPLLTVIYGQIIIKGSGSVDEATKKFILDAEEARTDKQVGADANGKGTTSIVVKGGVPAVFNFATENGAATRSVNGTTVTFRFNPVGLLETLTNQNYIEGFVNGFNRVPLTDVKKLTLSEAIESTLSNTNSSKPTDSNQYKFESKPINYFRKLGVGLSFDTTRGQTSPTLVGTERQLSALSVRYEFLNERDPRHPKYAEAWRTFFINEGGSLIQDVTAAEAEGVFADFNEGFKNTDLQNWLKKTNEAIKSIALDPNLPAAQAQVKKRLAVEAELLKQLELLPVEKLQSDAALLKAFNTITKSYVDFNAKEKELLNEIARAPVIAFEYTNNREPVLPDSHNLNLILAKGFSVGSQNDAPVMDLTFNTSLTFLNRKPIGGDVKRTRDFSFAGQIDVPLGRAKSEENSFAGTLFSLAGKYQRLNGDAIALDGTVLPNTKGDIWVGQAKLTIPLNFFGLRGIRFPISATFASRTELVRESRIKGNFGLTFDLDKLILSNVLRNFK